MYSSLMLVLVALLHLNVEQTTAGSLRPGNSGSTGPILISPGSNFIGSGTGGNLFVSGNSGTSGTNFNFGSTSGQGGSSSNIRVGPATPAGVNVGGSNFIGQAGTTSGQFVSGAGIQFINQGQSVQGSSGQSSGSNFGFNQNQGSSGQSSGTVTGGTVSFQTGSQFVNQGQGSFVSGSNQGSVSGGFISSPNQGSGSGIRIVNQRFGSQAFSSSNQGGFAQIIAPETLTVTDTTTIDRFVTVTETILNSVPVTITGFVYDTVTVTTRGLHQTQVDDVMSLTTTVVERPVTEFVTTAKSNFVYVTEVSVDIYTITHRAHLISQTTFTTVVVQTLTLSSPIVRTSLSTSVAVSTEYRTVVNTVFSHGYN